MKDRDKNQRHEVLISGLGGQGVVTIAKLLVEAAFEEYPHAFFFPSYSTEQRGGWVQCSAVLAKSIEESQPRLHPGAAIMLSPGGLPEIKLRLGEEGLLFVESSVWLQNSKSSSQYAESPFTGKVYVIPALEKARSLGSGQAANLVMIGAYLKATGALSPEMVEAALCKKMSDGNKAALLELNKKALYAGASLF